MFVGEVHGQAHVPELLAMLDQLVGGGNGGGSGAAAAARGSSVGLCAVAVTQGLLPGAASTAATAVGIDLMKRRLMPLLMVLLGRGEVDVQCAAVGALLEVLLRFGEDGKLVEQVGQGGGEGWGGDQA